MSTFPPYRILSTDLPNKDLTVLQKNDLVRKISVLDTETHSLMFALIKCYYIEHEKNSFAIPYNGILCKDRIDFDLLKFPLSLRQLLYKFVILHEKKIKEDAEFQHTHN